MSAKYWGFPSQKKTKSQRTKEWYKECIDAFDASGLSSDEAVRSSFTRKQINYNLYNGHLDMEDLVRFVNPYDLETEEIPDKLEHYPIAVPRLDLLIGESIKRRFDWTVLVSDPDSVSAKEEEKRSLLFQRVQDLVDGNYSEAQMQQKVRDLEHEVLYTFKDRKEIRGNKLLRHFWNKQRWERKFSDGFKDALISSEELYIIDVVGDEPVLNRLNPLNVFWLRSGFSHDIEDADVIYIDEYWNPGKIIDYFYEDLKPSEIEKLERGFNNAGGSDPFVDDSAQYSLIIDRNIGSTTPSDVNDYTLRMGSQGYKNLPYDQNGNIRVLRAFWRSFRRVKVVKYFDEFGAPQEDIFPDNYIPDEDKGETARYMWINEWLEGTRIGSDIYVRMRPRPVQYNKLSNPSYCHPGIVGSAYATNSYTAVSMMERTRPYQYLYDIYMDRLNKMSAKNQGKILELDLGMIPDDWDVTTWMHYLTSMNIAVKDSFKEGNVGPAIGKLAGNLGHAGHNTIDLQNSQYIQEHIGILEFIKREMTEIIGVSDQRLGQIENRETVGGVERSVTQSSHVTEWYFHMHENVRQRALQIFLETCKQVFKGKEHLLQNVLDDGSIEMFKLEGKGLEAEFDVHVQASNKVNELDATYNEIAKMAFQSDKASLSVLTKLLTSDSMSERRRIIENAERQKLAEQERQIEAQNEQVQAQIQAQNENEQLDRDAEERRNIRDNETKLIIAQSQDEGGEDNLSQLQQFYEKLSEERRQFDAKLQQDNRHHKDEIRVKEKQMAINAKKKTENKS